ncbi:MAG: AmmeMemoRadiSam system protein A [Treponema sp.]|jgi:AmmeMemoRadiSam system protein A|nr:AmmeMemoRadiSam system protein A [Treponema sp.]
MNFTITQEEQNALLYDARESIAARLDGRPPVYPRDKARESPGATKTSALDQSCGAFVTLHIGKQLRGCIGRMIASEALEKTVRTMASEAAFGDPRFPSLTKEEFERCCIEISALSPLELCPDPRSVRVGMHGLYLIHRGRSGVLLPQVPAEQGWDLDAYLDYICVKAGLPPHSYDEPGARLYTFTAAVFGEQDVRNRSL